MKLHKHVKAIGFLALACAIFTIGRLTVQKIWGITYNTRTIEILIFVGIVLHFVVPRVGKMFGKSESRPVAEKENSPSS